MNVLECRRQQAQMMRGIISNHLVRVTATQPHLMIVLLLFFGELNKRDVFH